MHARALDSQALARFLRTFGDGCLLTFSCVTTTTSVIILHWERYLQTTVRAEDQWDEWGPLCKSRQDPVQVLS
jgi:hypothetical protein